MTAQPSDSGAAATKARTAEPLYGGSTGRRVTEIIKNKSI